MLFAPRLMLGKLAEKCQERSVVWSDLVANVSGCFWVGIRIAGVFPLPLECCISAHSLELLNLLSEGKY